MLYVEKVKSVHTHFERMTLSRKEKGISRKACAVWNNEIQLPTTISANDAQRALFAITLDAARTEQDITATVDEGP